LDFQILGWLLIVSVETNGWFNLICYSFVAITVTHLFKLYFDRKLVTGFNINMLIKALIYALLLSLIITSIGRLPSTFFPSSSFYKKFDLMKHLFRVLKNARYTLIWIMIYLMYLLLELNRKVEHEKAIAQTLAKTNEVELLKQQFNPHFYLIR